VFLTKPNGSTNGGLEATATKEPGSGDYSLGFLRLGKSGRATEHSGTGSITILPNRVDQTLHLVLYRVSYLEGPIPESSITATGNGNTEVRGRGSAINHEFNRLPFDRGGSGSLPPSDRPLDIFVRRKTLPPARQSQLEQTLINGKIRTPVVWSTGQAVKD